VLHLPGFKDPALRIDQREALAAELEPTREINGLQDATSESSKPIDVIEGRLAELGILAICPI
jgi:hypothetical protein